MSPGLLLRSSAVPLPTGLVVLAVAAFALVYVGVILPTVWSRRPDRRAAAHRTLGMLLRALPLHRIKR
ncbi:hypothetical protein ACIPSJ_27370 [Streptomyces sp. NPDC090088]|uniref:hypothetical protein n=1 Tax=Streptomyces sp. NPDC090088 TaxID=3365944 RepID=UPI003827D532